MFDIRDYGAKPDGVTDNTAMIQAAINACAGTGGGTVLISGGPYLTYTLHLRSGVRLELEAGSSLEGGPDAERYPEVPDNPYWKPAHASRLNRRTLIYALNCDNIAITGRGTINGNAHVFHHTDDRELELHQVWKRKSDRVIPGRSLLFVGCRDILLTDFLILDSAGWSMWILDCDRIRIDRLRIDCDMRLPNVDGIHISSSRDAVISNCIIRSSDDAFAIRSHQEQLYTPKPCERIAVSNCTIQSGSSAVRIGWSNDYIIRNCSFDNLVIRESFAGFSIYIPKIYPVQFDPPRGPDTPEPPPILPFEVENIRFSNIEMETQASPFLIRLADDAEIAGIRNITLSGVSCLSGSYPFIRAAPQHGVRDIRLENSRFTVRQHRRKDFAHAPSFHDRMEFSAVENLQFLNVQFPSLSPLEMTEIREPPVS